CCRVSHRRKLAGQAVARLLWIMHISFAVFADAANLSQEGKLNILGVFDAVQVAGLPTIHPRTHFVVRLKANGDDTGQHKLTFRWLSPFDEELWSSSGEMTVAPSPNPVFDVDLPIIAVVDLPLNATGQYTMQVTLDGEVTATARLLVNANQTPMVAGTPNGMVS
ncbi:MAG TPA: hypothetical protein VK565_11975, partial [Gemmatimonadaceae bacterium]|nr:hypothetical protein [Gemmatimonadaceae bacterium]